MSHDYGAYKRLLECLFGSGFDTFGLITECKLRNFRRRYDFDQSRRVLSSDLHSISVLMAQMETDPPDITNSCEERNRLSLEIEALDIVINRCTERVNFPRDEGHSSGLY
ncbi:hypothetical protein TNCV_322371 [Trichonephila clavipes]|nr:hypothetical protein TNCV_322371 [Trichonephila clavipes]